MNTSRIIKELYERIDILEESKMMNNRLYISRAIRLINKLKIYKNDKTRQR